MYKYIPLLRPASSFTLPIGIRWSYIEIPADGSVRRPDLPRSTHRHGVIEVDRPLTAEEREHFDLRAV